MASKNRKKDIPVNGAVFESGDAVVLRAALDLAWDYLTDKRRTPVNRSDLASVIARLAGRGERDPGHLAIRALRTLFPEAPTEAL